MFLLLFTSLVHQYMDSQNISLFLHSLLLLTYLNIHLSFAADSITFDQPLYGNRTITSESGNFVLGFFENGFNFYVGFWHNNTAPLWIANRRSPVKLAVASVLRIADDGNLILLDESQTQVWSTNVSSTASNSTAAVLLDSGNFVLRDEFDSSKVFWQSCDHPTDTWFPGCYLGVNKVTRKNLRLTYCDPCWGSDVESVVSSFEVDANGFVLKDGNSNSYWYSGNWTGGMFSSEPDFGEYVKFEYISNATVNYFTYSLKDNETLVVFIIGNSGITKMLLDGDRQPLRQYPDDYDGFTGPYSVSKYCGLYGVAYKNNRSNCFCPQGFSIASPNYWKLGDHSGGCVRDVPLQCGTDDVFLAMHYTRVNDAPRLIEADSAGNCRLACLHNCSCTAYSYGRTCALWYGDLNELLISSVERSHPFYLRLGVHQRHNSWIVSGEILGSLACLMAILFAVLRCRRHNMTHKMKMAEGFLVSFRYSELRQITSGFSKRLGGGGFGSVFSGSLPDSTAVAVKKLEGVVQGEKQFRSEVSTLGTIQHVNLVRLLGFCSDSLNKLLVYEYMPNGSLDSPLFRNKTLAVLDWKTRYAISLGIARGLNYLHEKCRDCIIHCDIKPENILLDASFVPKVADFGLAKPVTRNFSRALTTMRGTIGYLAPEWISGESITAKVDVYSYGMMLLEIISGRRNTEISDTDLYFPILAVNQIAEGDVISLLDPKLEGNADFEELDRACKVACWCIQDNEFCRPTMSEVVQILEGVSEVSVPPMPKLLEALAENIKSSIYYSDGKTELKVEELP